jgi:hypothetical protein
VVFSNAAGLELTIETSKKLSGDSKSLVTEGGMDVRATNIVRIEKIAGIFTAPPGSSAGMGDCIAFGLAQLTRAKLKYVAIHII